MVNDKALQEWSRLKFGRVISEEELARRTSPGHCYKNLGKYIEPDKVDEIIKGVIDIHVHCASVATWLAGKPSMVETCIEASKAKIKALVFKDHYTMTNNCAIIAQELLDELKKEKNAKNEDFTPVEVYGGITLSYPVGGMNVNAVEIALSYGRCKEVWLPSRDAKHHRAAMGLEGGIQVSDGNNLTPETKKILGILADYNKNSKGERCALATSHVSNEEKVAILDYIKTRNMDIDIIIDHCTQEMTIVTPKEAMEMIDKGAYLQFAECSCIPWPGMLDWVIAFDYSMNLIKQLIKEKGLDHLVLCSDAGQPGNKPVAGWWHFIWILLSQGINENNINVMAKEVPVKLLGL
ncbi:MAG: DUF6282 family protein [Gammaproteobacteria bacterium]|nr:DUF6282 family protein [Gammaproteobacteria bacterium]